MFLATLQCQKETNNKTKQKKKKLAIKGPNRNSKKPDGKKKEKDEDLLRFRGERWQRLRTKRKAH